jgi:ABC-type nickel/cobalt efflux system permease component RcnA
MIASSITKNASDAVIILVIVLGALVTIIAMVIAMAIGSAIRVLRRGW